MTDVLLFGVLPYVSLALFLLVSIYRYRKNAFSVSSLSSQFLESRHLFWGSVPFHLGILTLFVGHLVAFMFPRSIAAWNGAPVRLLILEVAALVAGLLTLFGLVQLVIRRLRSERMRPVTTAFDVALYVALLYQVVTGLWVALGYRWGSAWFVEVLAPYLKSVCLLRPDVALVGALKWPVKLHVAGAWVLVGMLSFTRLMHVLVAPLPYLWRRPQVVVWNRDRRAARRVEG